MIRIPVHRPSIGEQEWLALREVLESRWLGMGPKVEQFEQELERQLGGVHVVAVSNCTAALHIALQITGVGPGDEVIVPSLSYISAPQAVLAVGARPVFCEVREEDLLLDPEDVARRITPRTRAIIAVHYGGRVCNVKRLREAAGSPEVKIIEDAAHAFGSRTGDGPAGTLGDLGCLSFDPIKNITCGEGGAVVTRDEQLAQRVRQIRNVGVDQDAWRRVHVRSPWYYEVHERGLRTIMTDVSAAIGLVQLRKLAQFRQRRLEIVRRYERELRHLPGIALLKHDIEGVFPFNFVIRALYGRRNQLSEHLRQKGIGTSVYYVPNHLQPLFGGRRGVLPVTERLYEEILSLPLASDLSEEEVSAVIAGVREFACGR